MCTRERLNLRSVTLELTPQCTEQVFLKISFSSVHELMPYLLCATQAPFLRKIRHFLLSCLMEPGQRVHKCDMKYFHHALLCGGSSDPWAREELKCNNPYEELGGHIAASFVFVNGES